MKYKILDPSRANELRGLGRIEDDFIYMAPIKAQRYLDLNILKLEPVKQSKPRRRQTKTEEVVE